MELFSSLDSLIWRSSICFFFFGLYFVCRIYLHLKVVAKLRLIWQSSFCKKGCLQMSRCSVLTTNSGQFGRFCKVRALWSFWLLWTSKRDFVATGSGDLTPDSLLAHLGQICNQSTSGFHWKKDIFLFHLSLSSNEIVDMQTN